MSDVVMVAVVTGGAAVIVAFVSHRATVARVESRIVTAEQTLRAELRVANKRIEKLLKLIEHQQRKP